MTRTGAAARPPVLEDEYTIMEWIQLRKRELLIATGLLLAIAFGLWFWIRSKEIQTTRAEQSLMAAEQSLQQGNVPLAQADLQRLITRYEGTSAAVRASILLAQVHYDQRQFQQGITALERIAGSRRARAAAPSIQNLIADGYMELGQFSQAAQHYRQAAELTRFESDRATYLSQAARAHAAGGDTAAAIRIWTELAADPQGPTAAEARVRLGELQARAASAQS